MALPPASRRVSLEAVRYSPRLLTQEGRRMASSAWRTELAHISDILFAVCISISIRQNFATLNPWYRIVLMALCKSRIAFIFELFSQPPARLRNCPSSKLATLSKLLARHAAFMCSSSVHSVDRSNCSGSLNLQRTSSWATSRSKAPRPSAPDSFPFSPIFRGEVSLSEGASGWMPPTPRVVVGSTAPVVSSTSSSSLYIRWSRVKPFLRSMNWLNGVGFPRWSSSSEKAALL
mmetsp:Transcript_19979/g.32367  ORF Transcript_19979/g.32367 Transcript_19979/m.32367 type:complete len:233 (-) Transcript_19979:246-944(-)